MRITKVMCEAQVKRLNTTLHGDPQTDVWRDGRWRSIPDRYVIDHSYGGYKLCRYCNTGGGQYEITNYRMSARELYYVIAGINTVLDLDAHRAIVNDALREAGHVCH